MGKDLLIWGTALALSAATAWHFARRPFRTLVDGIRFDRARLLFRQRREWLEARFLKSVAASDPAEALRWDDARWRDEIRWARDRQTRRLLALVGVEFEADPFDDSAHRHATALFEYRKGRWIADGKRVDALRPDEALLRHRRYEPVTPPDVRP